MTPRLLARAAALALLAAAVACADSVIRQVGPVNDPETSSIPDWYRYGNVSTAIAASNDESANS